MIIWLGTLIIFVHKTLPIFILFNINENINEKTQKGAEAELTDPLDKVRVFILATDEELTIARDTAAIVSAL